ncbi:hypothetical protein CMUST_10110 [Corynebacterium mustelae]|uniref:Uncharacterized protein n=1 Tax=Corynebacterium mustelae TaxID=571915 RepID=A0A0G3H3D7_9CORY|nr:hypothetical protein [Corynebacterium mustelae]AKK06338.1 hypothetical protein CMUST_10110 [Corynebacterium mustelae]
MHVVQFIDTTLTTRNKSNYQKVVELVHEHQLDYLDNPTYLRAWYYTIRAITHTDEVAWRFFDHLVAAARILKST